MKNAFAPLAIVLGLASVCLAQKPETIKATRLEPAQKEQKEFVSFVKLMTPQEAEAFQKKNPAFFEKLYAPTFQTINEHGVVDSRKIAMYLLKYHFNTLEKVNYHAKILSLSTANHVGTLKLMTVLDGVTRSGHGAKGGPVTVTRLEKQTFVKNGDQWQMSLDEDLKQPAVLMKAAQNPATAMKIVPAKH